MRKQKSPFLWGLVLLAGIFCWSVCPALSASRPLPGRPAKKNPYQQRKDDALFFLSDAIDARVQTDARFKKYVDSVNKYNNDMNDWAKRKKEELRKGVNR
jgi:hypothetical protein